MCGKCCNAAQGAKLALCRWVGAAVICRLLRHPCYRDRKPLAVGGFKKWVLDLPLLPPSTTAKQIPGGGAFLLICYWRNGCKRPLVVLRWGAGCLSGEWAAALQTWPWGQVCFVPPSPLHLPTTTPTTSIVPCPGFVANLVALIPNMGSLSVAKGYRQYNLSVWDSTEASHNWYMENRDHAKILQKYRNQGMTSFGAMLSQLEASPARPIRWQVRCRTCRSLVTGYPENVRCSVCGAVCQKMPLF